MTFETTRADLTISTDPALLDIETIHRFLSEEAYWAKGRPAPVVAKAIRNSLNFGLYRQRQQIGFARVVSDFATFAWLSDVFILPEHRAQGLGKWLVQSIQSHPELQGLRRWILSTADAHGLYRQFGFQPLANPARWLELFTDPPDYTKVAP